MVGRVLSRIFVWGGQVDPEKIFEPRSGRKFLKYSVQDWLKSHFWTLVTFTDSLKSSSKEIFKLALNFSRQTFFWRGEASPRPQ